MRQVARLCVCVERVKAGLRVVHVAAGSPPGWLPRHPGNAAASYRYASSCQGRHGMHQPPQRPFQCCCCTTCPTPWGQHTSTTEGHQTTPGSRLPPEGCQHDLQLPITIHVTKDSVLVHLAAQVRLPNLLAGGSEGRNVAARISSHQLQLPISVDVGHRNLRLQSDRQGGLGKEGEARQARRQASTGLQQLLLRPAMCAPTQPTTHSPHTAKTSDHPTPSHL